MDRLELGADSAGGAIITRERHRQNLVECVEHLDRFLEYPYQVRFWFAKAFYKQFSDNGSVVCLVFIL